MQTKNTLTLLAAGEFICDVRYPEEHAVLCSSESRQQVELWLGMVGRRLARLDDDGAFFMAHEIPSVEMRVGMRENLKSIRSKIEPMVGFLDFLRQTQGRNPMLHAGDILWESEIVEAIRNSSVIEQKLNDMRDIPGVRVSDNVNDRLRKMLVQMETEGYVIEVPSTSRGYKITGKINHFYSLLSFIAQNVTYLSDEKVVDQIDGQMRLDSDAESDLA